MTLPVHFINGKEDLLVGLDLETSGLSPSFHLPLEVAVVVGDRKFSSLIGYPATQLQGRSNEESMQIHGLSVEAISAAKPVYQVAEEFDFFCHSLLQDFGAKHLVAVGWNVGAFDISFLRHHFRDASLKAFSHRTMELNSLTFAMELAGFGNARSNKEMAKRISATQLSKGRQHQALYDAQEALLSLNWLLEQF